MSDMSMLRYLRKPWIDVWGLGESQVNNFEQTHGGGGRVYVVTWESPLWMDRLTDMTENIIFPQTTCAGGINGALTTVSWKIF